MPSMYMKVIPPELAAVDGSMKVTDVTSERVTNGLGPVRKTFEVEQQGSAGNIAKYMVRYEAGHTEEQGDFFKVWTDDPQNPMERISIETSDASFGTPEQLAGRVLILAQSPEGTWPVTTPKEIPGAVLPGYSPETL